MFYLSVVSFCVFVTYLASIILKTRKIPNMISSTYYSGGGIWFTLSMWVVALSMLVCILDCGVGFQQLAFFGCSGIMFVGAAPRFLEESESRMHKIGAVCGAIGCLTWCMSVNFIPFILLATLFVGSVFIYRMLHNGNGQKTYLFWSELLAFICTYITYWSII